MKLQKIKVRATFFIVLTLTAALTAVSYFFFTQKEKISAAAIEQESETDAVLASPYNSKETYDEVFASLTPNKNDSTATVGIVSHHFLAKELIANFYNKISSDKIETVFLVSPDHYSHFYASGIIAYTSKAFWNTPYGQLETDKNAINSLLISGNVDSATSALGLEHGIYIEIPFIKKFFANAKIVPIVLNSTANPADFEELGKQLKSLAGENSILIASSDFSHDSTAQQAMENDEKSIETLKNLNNSGNFDDITNDCKQCIAAIKGYLDADKKTYKFNLIENKNSSDFSDVSQDLTSYVSGYFSEKKDIQILFTGDLMFDRGIRYYASQNGSNEFIFDKIRPLLENQDLVISNLEGPITGNKSVSLGTKIASTNNYTFTFDPSIAQTLNLENIKLVNLGNNHVLNFYTAGLLATKKYLSDAEIEYFGAPDGDKSIIKTISGVKIGLVNYNEFADSATLDQSQTISEIQKLKTETDIIIVYCHWDIEYQKDPAEVTKNLAHQFINAGADLIIGSHPHVVQTIETYNNKKIYYSLGNFIFDQYFSDDVQNGLGVIVKINPETKTLQFEDINFHLDSNGQTTVK